MLVPKSCPQCHSGAMLVEHGDAGSTAICQQCGYLSDPDTVRRLLTLQALQAAREREKAMRG